MDEGKKKHEEFEKKFREERLWGKCGYVVTYANGVPVSTDIVVTITEKNVLKHKKSFSHTPEVNG